MIFWSCYLDEFWFHSSFTQMAGASELWQALSYYECFYAGDIHPPICWICRMSWVYAWLFFQSTVNVMVICLNKHIYVLTLFYLFWQTGLHIMTRGKQSTAFNRQVLFVQLLGLILWPLVDSALEEDCSKSWIKAMVNLLLVYSWSLHCIAIPWNCGSCSLGPIHSKWIAWILSHKPQKTEGVADRPVR